MPLHELYLVGSIDEHSLILKYLSKMADQREILRFSIVNIWDSFLSDFLKSGGILTHTGMNMAGHDLMMYILWFLTFWSKMT